MKCRERRRGRGSNDEEFFSGLDEAELAAGQVLDRLGVLPKLAGVLPQTEVLALQLGDRRGQLALLPIGTQNRRQALLADQRVSR